MRFIRRINEVEPGAEAAQSIELGAEIHANELALHGSFLIVARQHDYWGLGVRHDRGCRRSAGEMRSTAPFGVGVTRVTASPGAWSRARLKMFFTGT